MESMKARRFWWDTFDVCDTEDALGPPGPALGPDGDEGVVGSGQVTAVFVSGDDVVW